MNQSPAAAKCRNELLGDKGWDTMQNTTLQPKLALRPKKAAQIYHWVAFFVWSILAKAKSQRTYAWLEARKGKFMVQNRFQKRFPRPSSLKQETHVLIVFELFQNTGAMSPMPSSSGLRRQMLNIAKALGFTSTKMHFSQKHLWCLGSLVNPNVVSQTKPFHMQLLGILLGLLQTVEWIQLSADNLHR